MFRVYRFHAAGGLEYERGSELAGAYRPHQSAGRAWPETALEPRQTIGNTSLFAAWRWQAIESLEPPYWSSPEKVDEASAAGLLVSLDWDFGFENDY